MRVRDIMTIEPVTAEVDATLNDLARLMEDTNCGEIPITADGRLIGVVTDRDIVVRGIAKGRDPLQTTAEEIMTRAPAKVRPGMSLRRAIHIMEDVHVRRLPVVDREGAVVGILSMTDVCQRTGRITAGNLVRKISTRLRLDHPHQPEVFPPYY